MLDGTYLSRNFATLGPLPDSRRVVFIWNRRPVKIRIRDWKRKSFVTAGKIWPVTVWSIVKDHWFTCLLSIITSMFCDFSSLILAVVGHYTRYRWSCLKRILNVERILKVTKKSGNRERDVGCCLYETAVLFSMVFFGQRYKIWFQSLVRHLFNLWNQHVMTRETILLLIIILRKSPSKEEILRLEAVIILISFHY